MPATQYNTGFIDDESVNNSSTSSYFYKDLNLYFSRNPVTGDVSTVSDVQNIKRAVRNLVLLNAWEKPFHPEIGTNIRGSLFENLTPVTIAVLREKIIESLSLHEPRVTVTDVKMRDDLDNNAISCTIEFAINNVPEQIEEVELMLQRIR